MKDYLDGHSLMHPFSDDRSWVINEDPFYVPNGMKIAFGKNTVPDPETKAFLEKFREDTSRSIPNVKDFVVPLSEIGKRKTNTLPKIKKVIFNDPATIVLWDDGTKTVVKCSEGDTYSEWSGLAFCICKKLMGDEFHKVFKHWCDRDDIRKPIYDVRHTDSGCHSESVSHYGKDEITNILESLRIVHAKAADIINQLCDKL